MKKLTTILVCILVCSSAFAITSNAVITGKLGSIAQPCPIGFYCPTINVIAITNNDALFVMLKNGRMLISLCELGDFDFGDKITIYGNYHKATGYYYDDFYFLEIIAILHPVSSDRFSANGIGYMEEDKSTTPKITIENDSVIIQHIKFVHCGVDFVLKVSDIVNDTLYVILADTAQGISLGTCNFAIRINAGKATSQISRVFFNGVYYNISPTSNVEQINIRQIQISPNPTDGQITISGIENFDNATFELFDLTGSLIQSGVLAPIINLSVPQGIYLLTITQNQRVIAQERIVVK